MSCRVVKVQKKRILKLEDVNSLYAEDIPKTQRLAVDDNTSDSDDPTDMDYIPGRPQRSRMPARAKRPRQQASTDVEGAPTGLLIRDTGSQNVCWAYEHQQFSCGAERCSPIQAGSCAMCTRVSNYRNTYRKILAVWSRCHDIGQAYRTFELLMVYDVCLQIAEHPLGERRIKRARADPAAKGRGGRGSSGAARPGGSASSDSSQVCKAAILKLFARKSCQCCFGVCEQSALLCMHHLSHDGP